MAEVGEQAESGPAVALNGDGASKMPKREGGRRKIKRLGGGEAGMSGPSVLEDRFT
jgi:hypothetical protein